MRHVLILFLLFSGAFGQVLAQTGHFQMRRAEQFYDQKNWEKAAAAFQKMTGQPGADFNLGNVAFRQNQLETAAVFFKKVAEKPGSPAEKADAFFNLGNVFLKNEQFKAAEKAFENSLRLAPNRPDAKKNLQITKRKLKEKTPPPPPPPPKTPPPPLALPQRRYLDRGQNSSPEPISGSLTPEQARKLLDNIVVPDEQKNLRPNRAPTGTFGKDEKGW